MRLAINIDLDNDAFNEGDLIAACRPLVERALDALALTEPVTLRDVNGNKVGTAEVRHD